MIGNKLGFYLKSDEAIEKEDFSSYARICIGWKPHLPLPAWLEISTNASFWLQHIKVEEQLQRCSMCNKEGHSMEVCLICPKSKSIDSSLEARATYFVKEIMGTGQPKSLNNGTSSSMKVNEFRDKGKNAGNGHIDEMVDGDKFVS